MSPEKRCVKNDKRTRGKGMNLRERGIYRLPNGRELVVLWKYENVRRLYRLGGWERFELTEYEINDDGRLVCQGRLTAWDVESLSDTGRTAREFSHPLDRSLNREKNMPI
jgi:hypothetical protein